MANKNSFFLYPADVKGLTEITSAYHTLACVQTPPPLMKGSVHRLIAPKLFFFSFLCGSRADVWVLFEPVCSL